MSNGAPPGGQMQLTDSIGTDSIGARNGFASSKDGIGSAKDGSTLSVEPAKPRVMSVEELNRAIRGTLEGKFDLIWVQGEISNFKAHTSGHFYFSLKDQRAQVKAVMFRGQNGRLKFKPTDGMEVLVRGKISVYEPRGDFQIIVDLMEPVGAGALQKAFEQLKHKLQSEGLFEAGRNPPLPAFPRQIGIVTSPTGAAIRDILNILARRNRGVAVTVVPTLVQGGTAAPQICEALQKAWKLPNLDVIILGRGGGSIEDLWAFNDENLARLIAASPVPVISAVGHEIDFTIADFVADLRAPTPSAAAELAVRDVDQIKGKFQQEARLLFQCWQKQQGQRLRQIQFLSQRLVDPKRRVQDLMLRNDELLERLQLAHGNFRQRIGYRLQLSTEKLRPRMDHQVVRARAGLQKFMGMLEALSPLKTMDRGYSLAVMEGRIVRSIGEVKPGTRFQLRVSDGWIEAMVENLLPGTKEGDERWILKEN
ncbi:MAG: exodeoxyribonuclease VII large subunit [Bdellovibrio sp.]|nr:MAG: exodeoxyribonuclease VII large subunit [Bdellovibrio sp.]